ncbi:CpaF family protein [Sediminivirga luteola]|uniref:CpaF family protein n=1 Tax=Sediminivirga luteola TaxID=1774748 RepID=UPI001F58A4FF|nr:ATPase, T2SS/T4P/T4SS family [Sediminivirga luteola]MCI2266469.1 Flp pilus assembly complex ATPase component TadA [Sediminivirga luteola]
MAALDVINEEVRELVRRRGLNPRRDRLRTRELVDAVIADYEMRSLRSDLPVLPDPDLARKQVLDALAGFGPLQEFLDADDVEEVWINGPGAVFVSRAGVSELTTVVLTEQQIADLIEQLLESSGRRVDLSQPFADAALPDGSRVHVVLPDITRRHPSVNIRKFIARPRSLDALAATGTLSPQAARFLRAAVVAGANIVVSGATQAGKTTLLNTLASAIPARERVISCEEVFELNLPSRDWVAMQCRQPSLEGTGEVTLRTLVKEALRMRPDRILIGEVRAAEALDLLLALNAGLPGMGTLHANSARAAIGKLTTLPLLAGQNISSGFVVPTVAASIDLVVHCAREADGARKVTEIVAVPGAAEGTVVETEEIFLSRRGTLVRGAGMSHLGERFARAGLSLHEELGG